MAEKSAGWSDQSKKSKEECLWTETEFKYQMEKASPKARRKTVHWHQYIHVLTRPLAPIYNYWLDVTTSAQAFSLCILGNLSSINMWWTIRHDTNSLSCIYTTQMIHLDRWFVLMNDLSSISRSIVKQSKHFLIVFNFFLQTEF